MVALLDKILRAGEGRQVKNLEKLARTVNSHESEISQLSDLQLRAKTDEFKARLLEGEDLDDLLPEAFAVVREAGRIDGDASRAHARALGESGDQRLDAFLRARRQPPGARRSGERGEKAAAAVRSARRFAH